MNNWNEKNIIMLNSVVTDVIKHTKDKDVISVINKHFTSYIGDLLLKPEAITEAQKYSLNYTFINTYRYLLSVKQINNRFDKLTSDANRLIEQLKQIKPVKPNYTQIKLDLQ